MARGAAKQRQARKPAAPPKRPPRRPAASAAEQTMFFPRLRRQAKWAFAFMVLVFAGSFVFLGVGSGSSGIGDLLQGHFRDIFGGSSSTSISKLEDRVEKNPKDAHSWRLLGVQLEIKQRPDAAIKAYKRYVALVKNPSADVLERLGSLQLRRGDDYQQFVYDVQQQTPLSNPLAPPSSTKLGQALGTDAIAQGISSSTQSAVQKAFAAAQRNYSEAVTTYQRLAKTPDGRDDPLVYQSLGAAAEVSGKTTIAISAYKRFLRLAPDSANAPVIRQRLERLQAQVAPSKKNKSG